MGDFDLDLKNSKGNLGNEQQGIIISGLVWCPPEKYTVPVLNCASHHYCNFTEESTCSWFFSECGCPPVDTGSLKDCINGL